MRIVAFLLLGTGALLITACGGKVIVDGIPEGAGGAGGGGGAPSSSSSSSIASSNVGSSGTGGICPVNVGIEALCSQEGQVCPMPLSCCSGSATCSGGRWHFSAVKCGQPCTSQCGPDDFSCQANAVCVAYIGKITTYQCRDKPCAGSLACGCAEPLCAEQAMTCNNIQDGYKILCDCKGQC
jgi:hypothetical protein